MLRVAGLKQATMEFLWKQTREFIRVIHEDNVIIRERVLQHLTAEYPHIRDHNHVPLSNFELEDNIYEEHAQATVTVDNIDYLFTTLHHKDKQMKEHLWSKEEMESWMNSRKT